jgi:hypothetical protein
VYVRFADGGTAPGRSGPSAAPSLQPFTFIPMDKDGQPLAGDRDGKCGPHCHPGGGAGTRFAGPVIHLEIPGPCRYQFRIFTNQGHFVAEGGGAFTAEDLARMEAASDGSRRVARVVWTGRTTDLGRAGSGAYILSASVRNLGRSEEGIELPPQESLHRFGLLREP